MLMTTDLDARLFRKPSGQPLQLCHMGHLLMENRNALVVDAALTRATGTAEREEAALMLGAQLSSHSTAILSAAPTGADVLNTAPAPRPAIASLW